MLYRQHGPDVFRFAVSLTGDRSDADDITAETFARALLAREPIVTATAKGYLFTIARNVFLRTVHKQARMSALAEHSSLLVDSGPGADARTEQRDELRLASRNLARLPEIDRSALLLRAVHELPYDEIARVLGITAVAAKVKVHRARLALVALHGGSRT